jgi:hypothetical protein
MVAAEITILVIFFVIYAAASRIHPAFKHIVLFITFVFAFVVSSREFASFYLLMYLVVFVLDLTFTQIDTTVQVGTTFNYGRFTAKGFNLVALQIVFGVVIYIAINLISRQVGGNIIGVPDLAITSSEIGKSFKPMFESALGIIENQFTFVIFDILLAFGVLIPLVGLVIRATTVIIPTIIAGAALGIFHVAAYSVSIGLIIYASIAFMLFILSRLIVHDSLPADTAHYINNALVSVSRGLKVV